MCFRMLQHRWKKVVASKGQYCEGNIVQKWTISPATAKGQIFSGSTSYINFINVFQIGNMIYASPVFSKLNSTKHKMKQLNIWSCRSQSRKLWIKIASTGVEDNTAARCYRFGSWTSPLYGSARGSCQFSDTFVQTVERLTHQRQFSELYYC